MSSLGDAEIRPAEADDLGAVLALHGRLSGVPHRSLADMESELADAGTCFTVAEARGRIVGYSIARFIAPEAELNMIAVHPGEERRGHGTRLFERVEEESRRRGCGVLRLEVSEKNAPARAFYDRCGFRVVGRRAKYYNDGADALLMDKQLK